MSKGRAKRIRVGIIGANPERGWAAQAHIPALTSLSDDFEITALSTTRRESADAAAKLFGVPLAFDRHQDLVNNSAVDVVAVTVKVPYHLELATAALDAGKAVYCTARGRFRPSPTPTSSRSERDDRWSSGRLASAHRC